ncbi:DUF1128 domain-containing protein [Tenuibacillus multivorans]|uniref:Uncharacterized protein YfkK, UPF0435 family n=1 Tax=Tenuibacillus multivorans TaxID=237069 RepID=A0A1G9Y328_9BACI|nr:DUF1128 domain-containing protein [Tenuibacillus multivorans]GEL75907.1 hypothetical protein TMU01_01420 [Tenuibacillus multivorans]SDN02873.1 Uncharacterized protein YfkK, UPF0435 family [Tenuibacillus multivorans]
MNLNEATEENLKYIIDEMSKQLQVLNPTILDPEKFHLDNYHNIKQLYDMVQGKDQISVPEIHAIIDELKKYRIQD